MITSNRGGWGEPCIAVKLLLGGYVPTVNEEGGVTEGAGLKILGVKREDSNLTCWRVDGGASFEVRDEKWNLVRKTSFDRFRY